VRSTEVDLRFQIRAGVGGREGFFELDAAGLVKVAEGDVEGLDAAFAAGGDGFRNTCCCLKRQFPFRSSG